MMIRFRKTAAFLSSLALLAALSSCGGPELLSIYPVYVGEPVTTTHHTFEKEDFRVIGNYAGGKDAEITRFDLDVQGMEDGFYVILISCDGFDNEVYVPIEAPVYPSDFVQP